MSSRGAALLIFCVFFCCCRSCNFDQKVVRKICGEVRIICRIEEDEDCVQPWRSLVCLFVCL